MNDDKEVPNDPRFSSQVDPDPVVIAGLSMTAAGLVLQLMQTWKAFQPNPPNEGRGASSRPNSLSHLEQAVSKLQADLRRLNRIVEHGSSDPDSEFYDAPYRIAQTALYLNEPDHMLAQNELGMSFSDLGSVAVWVNHIIREDPPLAYRLGSRIAGGLEGTAFTLNEIMATGGPIRTVLAEARSALEQLAAALEEEIGSRN